jgi:hypothetical protein
MELGDPPMAGTYFMPSDLTSAAWSKLTDRVISWAAEADHTVVTPGRELAQRPSVGWPP